MGIDTASRTGWCWAKTNKKHTIFNYGFIDIDTNDKYFKYNQYIRMFSHILMTSVKLRVIIEESFYGKNVKVFQMLSRFGAFIYCIAHLKNIKDKRFILASQARNFLNIKNAKKEIVQKEFKRRLNLKIKDNDVIDAMILSLNGILKGSELMIR